ncbi:hypothetical protein [Bosea sp. RAC05]|uniref:hypothetical protein n=1 Tax=Bosea sp. RAC05 TaxID=1842539 RepID=UPI00083DDAF7|nr:hypothetical protein [Bosea sp. RAC05]AOG03048.1 hypothetical protein BSY19_4768 [Bosea sp. RAC05]
MDRVKFSVPFVYEIGVQKPRGRTIQNIQVLDHVDVECLRLSSDEAPIAIRAVDPVANKTAERRLFDDKLYRMTSPSMGFWGAADHSAIEHQLGIRWQDGMTSGCVGRRMNYSANTHTLLSRLTYDTLWDKPKKEAMPLPVVSDTIVRDNRDEVAAQVVSIMSKLVFVDDILHEECHAPAVSLQRMGSAFTDPTKDDGSITASLLDGCLLPFDRGACFDVTRHDIAAVVAEHTASLFDKLRPSRRIAVRNMQLEIERFDAKSPLYPEARGNALEGALTMITMVSDGIGILPNNTRSAWLSSERLTDLVQLTQIRDGCLQGRYGTPRQLSELLGTMRRQERTAHFPVMDRHANAVMEMIETSINAAAPEIDLYADTEETLSALVP